METKKNAWYLEPIAVILLLFFALGPFALPLLYKSPKFGSGAKISLTILTLLFTGTVIFYSYQAINQTLQRLDEMNRMFNY